MSSDLQNCYICTDSGHICDDCQGNQCVHCCTRKITGISLGTNMAPNKPPKKAYQQQRPPRPPRSQQQPMQKRYHAPQLHQVAHLPTNKQIAACFYHLASSCARVVHAFSGPLNMSVRYDQLYQHKCLWFVFPISERRLHCVKLRRDLQSLCS